MYNSSRSGSSSLCLGGHLQFSTMSCSVSCSHSLPLHFPCRHLSFLFFISLSTTLFLLHSSLSLAYSPHFLNISISIIALSLSVQCLGMLTSTRSTAMATTTTTTTTATMCALSTFSLFSGKVVEHENLIDLSSGTREEKRSAEVVEEQNV